MPSIASGLWAAITRYSLWDILTVVGGGVAVTAIGAFLLGIVGDIRTSGAAKAQVACVEGVNKSNNAAFEELAEANRRAAVAAQAERDKARADADTKAARIVVLQTLLANQPATEQCGYSADITGALRK